MRRPEATLSSELRRLRGVARMSQEALASEAGVSGRTVSDLERGVHTSARPHTITLLAEALKLSPPERDALLHLATPHARRSPVRPPLPRSLARDAQRSVLRGRDDELRALGDALERAAAGAAQLVTIAGSAGMGKSRLLAEIATRADADGAVVLFARADDAIGDPYHAFVQILRQYINASTADTFIARSPRVAAVLAALLPELELEPPGHGTRAELFDAIADTVDRCARDATCVLLFDDAHHVDRATLQVLRHVLRANAERRVIAVVAYRPDDAARPTHIERVAAELSREMRVTRLALTGLDSATVEQVVADQLSRPYPALARSLHKETAGNPFFVTELIAQLAPDHLDGHTWSGELGLSEHIGVPEGVRDVLSARLAQLPPESRAGLTVCAVVGNVFDVHLVSEAMRTTEDDVFAFVDAGVRAGVVAEEGVHGRWHFAHPLFRTVLSDELSDTARARLHGRVVVTLEACGIETPEVLDKLAYHGSAAHTLPGMAPRAVEHARRAAADATRVFAWERAATQYERAVDVLEAQSDRDDAQFCDLLLALGDARLRSLDRQRALPVYLHAAELATSLGDDERLVRAAVGYGYMAKVMDADDRALELWQKALTDVVDPDMRATLLAACATHLTVRGRDREARHESARALELARDTGDERALATALAARSIALWGTPQIDERFLLGRELAAHGGHNDHDEWLLDGVELAAVPLLELGRVDAFDAVSAELASAGRRVGHAASVAQATQWHAMRALMRGDLVEASRLAREVIEIAPNAPNFAIGYDAQRMMINRAAGRQLTVPALDAATLDQNPAMLPWSVLAAILLAEQAGDPATQGGFDGDAHRALDLVVERVPDAPRSWTWLISAVGAATAATMLQRVDAVTVLQPLIEPYSGRLVVTASGTSCEGPVDVVLGMLAATRGDETAAREWFEAALALHDRVDGDALRLRTHREYAQFLRSLGDQESASLARRLERDAAAIAAAHGLVYRPALRPPTQGRARGRR